MRNGKYILVIAPDNWPGMKYRGRYCYEHHYIYWLNTGIVPKDDEIIHHKDENPHNNDFFNLELLTKKEHDQLHSRQQKKIMVKLQCPICNEVFVREKRQTHLSKPSGTFTCCSRSCASKLAGKCKQYQGFANVLEIYNGM